MVRIAMQPETAPGWMSEIVREAGAEPSGIADAEALLWFSQSPDGLAECLARGPGIAWVQLPMAGVERFRGVFDDRRVWTCAKDVYSDVVAEHALTLSLAAFRGVAHFARQRSWTTPAGRTLSGANVVVLGGGGIATRLLALLAPFGVRATVVRRSARHMSGARRVVGTDQLHPVLVDADLVVVALALTPATRNVIGATELQLMKPDAWLVNVARGEHVDTAALVAALASGSIGGAALDVTDPEPLPDGHPLWTMPNCIITPHTANTPAMLRPRLAAFTRENIVRFAAGQPLAGRIDVAGGY